MNKSNENDVEIQHHTPTITEYNNTLLNQHIYTIDYQDYSTIIDLHKISDRWFSDTQTCVVPTGYIEEVKKRLYQQEFYVNAKRKKQVEDRIIKHAVALLQVNLLNVKRWKNDSSCKYLKYSDWKKFYKRDNHKGYRSISIDLMRNVISEKLQYRNELIQVLTSNYTLTVPPQMNVSVNHVTTDTEATKDITYNKDNNTIDNRYYDTTIGGTVREYPPILQRKKDGTGGRASNIFRLNPYFMRQTRITTDILTKTELKNLGWQKLFVITNYGYGLDINRIEAENIQLLKLISTDEALEQLETIRGTVYRDGDIVDDKKIEELLQMYNNEVENIVSGKLSFKKKAVNRHYTPLQRISRPIRRRLAKLNNRRESDYKSLHPNIIFSLLLRSLDTEWFKLNGLDIDYLYEMKFIPELSNDSRKWLLSILGNAKTNLSVYYDGDVGKCKIENLTYYNDRIKNSGKYDLHNIYLENCPELVKFLENIKHTDHRKMSTLLLKMESVIMESIVFQCDNIGIFANGIHDAVMVLDEDFNEAKDIMNKLADNIGLSSYVE